MATGFLLHSRPYRESSSLLVFFTEEEGRLDLVGRASRRSARRAVGAPVLFAAYDLLWAGQRELRTLQSCEPVAPVYSMVGKALFCGLYINELLYRLLPRQMPEHALFACYRDTLLALGGGGDMEPALRQFERCLLDSLGYGITLHADCEGRPLDPAARYLFLPEQGLIHTGLVAGPGHVTGEGRLFLSIHANDYASREARYLAKQLMRAALAPYLGDRPLHSRSLFLPS